MQEGTSITHSCKEVMQGGHALPGRKLPSRDVCMHVCTASPLPAPLAQHNGQLQVPAQEFTQLQEASSPKQTQCGSFFYHKSSCYSFQKDVTSVSIAIQCTCMYGVYQLEVNGTPWVICYISPNQETVYAKQTRFILSKRM